MTSPRAASEPVGARQSAQTMSTPFPPAPPMLKDTPRRQAQAQVRRAATGQHSCAGSINPPLSPYPLTEGGFAPGRGRPEGKGGAARGFLYPGCHRHSRGPVDCIACHYASRVSTKRSGRFARFEIPRVGCFLPRVGLFYPRVCFSVIWTISLSFSFFIEEREKEKGAPGAARPSTGRENVKNMYPRVGDAIHGFSVDCFLSRCKHWRGLRADRASIHGSTGRNACVPPTAAQPGGVHG